MSDKILKKDLFEIQRILVMPVSKERWELYCQTDYWKKLSQKIKGQAGNKCMVCNCGGTLNVHHRSYDNIGDPEKEQNDLVCLCSKCHKFFHEQIQGKKINKIKTYSNPRRNKRKNPVKERKSKKEKIERELGPERINFLKAEYLVLPKNKRRFKVMRKLVPLTLKEWSYITSLKPTETLQKIESKKTEGILAQYLKASKSKFRPTLSAPWAGYEKKVIVKRS